VPVLFADQGRLLPLLVVALAPGSVRVMDTRGANPVRRL
jgi:hypothetical protein